MKRVSFFKGKSIEILYNNKVYELIMTEPECDFATYLGLTFDRDTDGSFDYHIQIEVTNTVFISRVICNKVNIKMLDGVLPVISGDKIIYEGLQHVIENIEMVLVRDKVRNSNYDIPFKYPFEYNEVIYIKAEDGMVNNIIDFSKKIQEIVQAIDGASCDKSQEVYTAILAIDDEKNLLESICPFEDVYFNNS